MHKRNQRIEQGYGLRPTDESLDWDEYFVKVVNPNTGKEKIFKGFVCSINFDKEREVFQLAEVKERNVITGSGNFFGDSWWYKCQLYDNYDDCKEDAHAGCDYWEDTD
jgi:hypothetical protein